MTQEPRQPASDLIGDMQRWLVRSGARGVSRGVGDQIRTALRGGGHADVWETATADEEPPECAWCPICRARRRLRESGPGLASHVAAATDAVGVVVQDAMSAFEAAVAAAGRQARPGAARQSASEVWDVATDEPGGLSLVGPPGPRAAAQPAPSGAAADAGPPATSEAPDRVAADAAPPTAAEARDRVAADAAPPTAAEARDRVAADAAPPAASDGPAPDAAASTAPAEPTGDSAAPDS